MRILMVPASTLVDHDKDSLYLQMKDYADWLVRNADEPVYFYWLLMGSPSMKELQRAGEVFWKKGKIVAYQTDSDDMYDNQYLLPMNRIYRNFNRMRGKYVVDAVITAAAGASLMVKRVLMDMRRRHPHPPMFVLNPNVFNFEHDWFKTMNQFERFLATGSYVQANQIVLTEEEKRQVFMNLRKYVAPSLVRKSLEENINVVTMGIRTDLIKKVKEESSGKHDKFTLFFGGRLNRVKRVGEIVEWYSKIYARRDVQIIFSTNANSSKEFSPEEYPHIKIYWNQNREQFLRRAVKAHVSIYASRYASFPAGVFEQMYAGVVMLLPDRKWVDAIFGDREYPLKFSGKNDALQKLLWVMDNYEKAQELVSWVPDFIDEMASSDKVFQTYHDLMVEEIDEDWRGRDKIGRGNLQLVKDAAHLLGEEFSFEELEGAMKTVSDTFDWPVHMRARTLTKFEANRWLKILGYEDQCEREMPDYKKVRESREEGELD